MRYENFTRKRNTGKCFPLKNTILVLIQMEPKWKSGKMIQVRNWSEKIENNKPTNKKTFPKQERKRSQTSNLVLHLLNTRCEGDWWTRDFTTHFSYLNTEKWARFWKLSWNIEKISRAQLFTHILYAKHMIFAFL